MPKTYSQDLRERVLAAYDHGMSTAQIARVFIISRAWARRVKQRRRDFGETTPRRRGVVLAKTKIDRDLLAKLVQDDPDATLLELRERLGVPCATSTISVALKRLQLTFKKRRCMRPNAIGRMSSSGARNGSSGAGRSTSSV